MIKTSRQLKDKIKLLSNGDSNISQMYLRNYFMERFLERISVSEYCENFVLKGGMLVASLIGLQMRATMDIDTTVRALNLSAEDAERIVGEIIGIDVDDGVSFEFKSIDTIMEEHEYTGVRILLNAAFDNIRQPIKMDISTGDVITPSAINYNYTLMFEDRSIGIYTYNVETLLAEKLETILARGLANTRLRDFYDIYTLKNTEQDINNLTLYNAYVATSKKRNTLHLTEQATTTLNMIKQSTDMKKLWEQYCNKNKFVGMLEWDTVIDEIIEIFDYLLQEHTVKI